MKWLIASKFTAYTLLKWWLILEFSHIDGRPRFAKHSIDDNKKVKIAAIDPDFYWD